jgi:hypothetical protein
MPHLHLLGTFNLLNDTVLELVFMALLTHDYHLLELAIRRQEDHIGLAGIRKSTTTSLLWRISKAY